MPARTVLPALMIGTLLALPAAAEETERYRLERTDGGFVRMDMASGHMSLCREQGSQLVCRSAVDEREAYHRDIGDLEARIEGLEQRLAELERLSILRPDVTLPSDEDFDRTLSQMEQFIRRFLGIVREFDNEPVPDRT
jgi:hypothetical protein